MTETKPIQMPISERQTNLIKATFKDNEFLLKAIRNLFFGFAMAEQEKSLISNTFAGNPELRDVVRKKIYPIFEEDTKDLTIGLYADYWIDIEKEILGAHSTAIYQRVTSKQKMLDMLKVAFTLLENPNGTPVDLSYIPNLMADEWQIGLLARSLYIRTVNQGLVMIKAIADMKEESPTDKAKRIAKDSSK